MKLSWKEDPKQEKFGAVITERCQKTKNFCNLQAKKDPGFHAKWNCWDQFWPGVAPCEGQLEKKWAKLAETSLQFFHSRLKNCHFSPNFYRKNNIYASADAQQSAEQNMSAVAWRYGQPNLRYLPSKSKKFPFLPIWDRNLQFWSTKSSIWTKCQQDKVLTICPGGCVPIFSKICWKLFKFV